MTRATQRFITFAAHLLLLAFVCIPAVNAQDAQPQATPQATPLPAPPPFKMIVKEERDALEQQSRDSSKRLKLTIEYAGGHLTRAEQHTARENFEAASAEIGMYHALIESALAFLSTFKRDSNKTRDLYKRLELSLRADGPRLTAMRRITPLEYAVWIKKVEDFARAGRTEALNSFYGHTVVREPEKKEKPKESPTPEDNQP
jgi:transposase